MARVTWKSIYFNRYTLLKSLKKKNLALLKKKKIFIFDKSLTILKSFIGSYVLIYKGNLFRKLLVNKYAVGYKFGEFTHTRKPFTYPVKKKKKTN